jgi:hypothetical protein
MPRQIDYEDEDEHEDEHEQGDEHEDEKDTLCPHRSMG